MNLCAMGHDEICYDGSRCPLCDTIKDKDDEIGTLQMMLKTCKKKLEF